MSADFKMYQELASWWHLLSSPADYEDEAYAYRRILEGVIPQAQTLLELGSGGGNNASWLKDRYEMTLVDLSAAMQAESRRLNPECDHVIGDMRSVRLGRTFDAVFVHDAIMYMTTEDDLGLVAQTAAEHLPSGGVALFVPDCTTESFRPSTSHGGHDSADGGRGFRYLCWERRLDDGRIAAHYTYLVREGSEVRSEYEEQRFTLFPRDTWLRALGSAGFGVSHKSGEENELFLCRKA